MKASAHTTAPRLGTGDAKRLHGATGRCRCSCSAGAPPWVHRRDPPPVLLRGMLLGKTILETRASAWDGTKEQATLWRGSRKAAKSRSLRGVQGLGEELTVHFAVLAGGTTRSLVSACAVSSTGSVPAIPQAAGAGPEPPGGGVHPEAAPVFPRARAHPSAPGSAHTRREELFVIPLFINKSR